MPRLNRTALVIDKSMKKREARSIEELDLDNRELLIQDCSCQNFNMRKSCSDNCSFKWKHDGFSLIPKLCGESSPLSSSIIGSSSASLAGSVGAWGVAIGVQQGHRD